MVDLFLVAQSHSDGLYGHRSGEGGDEAFGGRHGDGGHGGHGAHSAAGTQVAALKADTRSSSSSTPTTRDPRAPTTTSPTKREPTPPLTTLAHHVRPRRRRPRRPRASPPRISDSQFETAVGDGLNVEIIDVEIPGKDYSLSLDEVVGTWRAGQHTAATN